jgi:hypothetical protein
MGSSKPLVEGELTARSGSAPRLTDSAGSAGPSAMRALALGPRRETAARRPGCLPRVQADAGPTGSSRRPVSMLPLRRRRFLRRGCAARREAALPGSLISRAGSALPGLAWRPVGGVMSSAQKAMSSSALSWSGGTSLRRVLPEASAHMRMRTAARTSSPGSPGPSAGIPESAGWEGGRAVPPVVCLGKFVLRRCLGRAPAAWPGPGGSQWPGPRAGSAQARRAGVR